MNLQHKNRGRVEVSRSQFIFAFAFCIIAVIVLMVCDCQGGEVVQYEAGVPAERMAVETLITHFDDGSLAVIQDPVLDVPVPVPGFVVYARACAKLDGAVEPLVEVLANGSVTSRLAAAVALAEVGADAIAAEPVLRDMLSGTEIERRMAAGVIQGIGPAAEPLLNALAPNLYSENFHVQYWTCRALAAIGPAAANLTPDLCYLAENGVASVRRNACLALGDVAVGTEYEQLASETLTSVLDNEFLHPVKDAARVALANFFEKSVSGFHLTNLLLCGIL